MLTPDAMGGILRILECIVGHARVHQPAERAAVAPEASSIGRVHRPCDKEVEATKRDDVREELLVREDGLHQVC